MFRNKKNVGFTLALILLLGGMIRALFLIAPYMDSDQAVTGLMARHILGGEFPFFFYGQDYCGSIEAYLVSTIFLLFGASRFTLGLTIFLESLFFILFIYFLARLISDKKTACLSALCAALPSYYLIFHSVLARAAYIEIPIIGVLLFIFSQKIIYQNESTGKNFFFLGFLCGLGMWTHFLVVFYLAPIFLLLFIKDKWFWKRPTIFFFFLGLILGGLPLWAHNTANPLVTWYYLMIASGRPQPILISLWEFFLYRFPEMLGVLDNETQKFFIPFFSFPLYIGYLSLFLFLFLSYGKNLLSLIKFKIDHSSGGDLLLLFLLFFPLIFALSGFSSGHTSRYLQPLFSVLPILMAVFIKKIKSYSIGLALLFCLAHLFSNVYGTIVRLPLISKSQINQYRLARENDRNLFTFLKEINITRLYCFDYWSSIRLTFDAQEKIIFAQPVGDRYPFYSRLIDRDPKAAFLFGGEDKEFEKTIESLSGSFRKKQVFGYDLFYDFSPPPYRFIELEPINFKVTVPVDQSATLNVFDRDMGTRWSSMSPQQNGIFLQIDLGQTVSDLGRITLLAGKPEDAPRGLRLEISQNGRDWQLVREVPRFWGSLVWSGFHPFYRPQDGRIDIIFSPRPGRYIRLTQLGTDPVYFWSMAECYIYKVLPQEKKPTHDLKGLGTYLQRFDVANIWSTPWIQSQLPWEWQARQRALTLRGEKEGLILTLSDPVFVVEKENATALTYFLKNSLRRPFQKTEVDDRLVFSFPPSTEHFHPLSSKNWRFQTNYNPQQAYLAADGKISTRWTTDRPQVPGAFFQIDLGKLEKVARMRLLVGNSRNDFPRGYEIRYSTEGKTWTSLNSIMSPGLLHWTGETLLKSGEDLDIIFPSTPMRYLQITQTGKDDVYYWSIHELELYQREGR
ncbi:MAG: discoidin domain-containing protein [Pseudomonadota bacterium]